jgi:5-deoxy-glucuronate isomerase
MTVPSPTNRYVAPRDTAATSDYSVEVSARTGWPYGSLRVLELPPGGTHVLETGREEMLVLPLAGGCRVECPGLTARLHGRPDVFTAVTDFAYLPRDTTATLSTDAGGRFALPGATTDSVGSARYAPSESVPIEVRGAGRASRQVNNFCSPEGFPAHRLMAVEVLTPPGNWSSYPPHKHDREAPDEADLHEIYYFEVASAAGDEVGYQRIYSSGPDHEIQVVAPVRSGDVVLVPFGYHGPTIAPPGGALYFLNVLDGPGEARRMTSRDDPELAFVRASWTAQDVDVRVPMYGRANTTEGPA